MRINVEENLINYTGTNSSIIIENEIGNFLDTDEGQNIKEDIELLNQMGFDKKMINKVYILLRPENLERAIDYMTEINGIYQHNFIASSNPREKSLCFICKKPKQNHLDYIPENISNENINNNFENKDLNIIEINDNKIQELNTNDINKFISDKCEVCLEEINYLDKKNNSIGCGHLFCTHCWFNYLKTLILEAKIENIKCMNHECNKNISDEFILKHISEDNKLIEKYIKFKKRSDIIKDKNKKLCPNPDCDSFLKKTEKTKYTKCENGHQYCFECLKPPHGNKTCDYVIDKTFMKWKKGKKVKRCPRCYLYTEKNEGCNHMTCANCKYQWCWLCEGKYSYNHYELGRCKGQQFAKAFDIKEIEKQSDYYGLHKIFKCVYKPVDRRIVLNCFQNYLLLFGFWFFGYAIMYVYIVGIYFTKKADLLKDDFIEIYFLIILIFSSLAMLVAFQISFTCILTPFMIVSLVYPKFFEKILIFFEIGND